MWSRYSEIIFGLPNGMHAYYISGPEARRLDRAPVSLVADRSNPAGPEIVNGHSCMGCHSSGIRPFRDVVRAAIEKQDASAPYDRDKSLKFYLPQAQLDRLFERDSLGYKKALEQAGASPGTPGQPEPINALARKYAVDVSLRQAALETGFDAEVIRKRLAQSPRLLSLGLGDLLVQNGHVRREVWQSRFPTVVAVLQAADAPAGVNETKRSIILVAPDRSHTADEGSAHRRAGTLSGRADRR